MIYFVPEAGEEYDAIGLEPEMSYFASRAAAMGAVGAGTVIATFFNFDPRVVHVALPAAWERATPAAVLAARFRAADRALRRILGEAVASSEMEEAAGLARAAAEEAGRRREGRPLFAAHADLDWPTEPHLVLWHSQTLLREFRGDAHVALLTAAGLSAVEALVAHAGSGEVPDVALRNTRAWSDADWQAGVDSMRDRGWLDAGAALVLSDAGRAHRQQIEDETDRLSVEAYSGLGEPGCERLRQLCRPWSRSVVDAGALSAMTRPAAR
jgi:hypothetical protein